MRGIDAYRLTGFGVFIYFPHVLEYYAAAHLAVAHVEKLYRLHECVGKMAVESFYYPSYLFFRFFRERGAYVGLNQTAAVSHDVGSNETEQVGYYVQHPERQQGKQVQPEP